MKVFKAVSSRLNLLFSFFFLKNKIFDTSEETPSPSLSPANPEHADSVAPLLPSAKQKGKESDPCFDITTVTLIFQEEA